MDDFTKATQRLKIQALCLLLFSLLTFACAIVAFSILTQ